MSLKIAINYHLHVFQRSAQLLDWKATISNAVKYPPQAIQANYSKLYIIIQVPELKEMKTR